MALPLLAFLLSTASHGNSVQPLHILLTAHPPNTWAPPQSLSSGTGIKSQGLETRNLTAPPNTGPHSGESCNQGTTCFTYWDQQEPG